MIRTLNILAVIGVILILSCDWFVQKPPRNIAEASELLEELKERRLDFDDGSRQLFEFRDTLLRQNDISMLVSLDSLLLKRATAPELSDSTTKQEEDFFCGTYDNASDSALRVQEFDFLMPLKPINIPVAFHIIYFTTTNGNEIGRISRAKVDEQMAVLNDAFANTIFTFNLVHVDSTQNEAWFKNARKGTQTERNMKRALTIDPLKVLNVYTVGIGYSQAYYPWVDNISDSLHGVLLDYTTFPGGSDSNYNLGKTLGTRSGSLFRAISSMAIQV